MLIWEASLAAEPSDKFAANRAEGFSSLSFVMDFRLSCEY